MTGFVERMYLSAPPLLQSAGISFVSLQRRVTEYGAEFQEALAECERNQWLSRNDLVEWQGEKLRGLIRHCYHNVPYYRRQMDERKLTPEDFRSISDLEKMPLLGAEAVRQNWRELINSSASLSRLRPGHTGGTTGSPLKVFYDQRVCIAKNAAEWRLKRSAGIDLGSPTAVFWGRVLLSGETTRPPFWRRDWVRNQLFCSSYHLTIDSASAYVAAISRFGAAAIEGYPSTLHALAKAVLGGGMRVPLRAVFCSSETLFPQQRQDMERAFECPVFDFYGMAERVIFATDCDRHAGMHLNMDFGITEVVDDSGSPVSSGTLGWLVGTGLHNHGMPLIRYRSGDVTSVINEPCACGRGFDRMGSLTSRAESIVTTLDGRVLSFASLSLPFKQFESIVEAQIIQEASDRLVINVVRRPNWTSHDESNLSEEFAKRIGAGMRIEFRYPDRIQRTSSGKFPFVISRYKPALRGNRVE